MENKKFNIFIWVKYVLFNGNLKAFQNYLGKKSVLYSKRLKTDPSHNITSDQRMVEATTFQNQCYYSQIGNNRSDGPENKGKNNANSRFLDFTNIYGDVKTKLLPFTKDEKKSLMPELKTVKPLYNHITLKGVIYSIIMGIIRAKSDSSRLRRLEELLNYLQTNQEAIVIAAKLDAIPLLLTLRRKLGHDLTSLEVINQLFALFGYVDPPKSRGLRILSIDGGGMRGIAVIKMLQRIEELCGKKIYELFDLICGVSTGAIITCCLVPPHCMPLEEIYLLYRSMSLKIFKQNTLWGTSRLVWTHAYYDTKLWEALLRDYVGEIGLLQTNKNLKCPKMAIVSTIVNYSRAVPYIFRNYSSPYERCSEYHGNCTHSMFEAVRASAAAPTIFEEYKTGNILHQDGGLMVNNPTAIALHEARTLWPTENIFCIVSCGTGKYEPMVMTDQLLNLSQSSSSWRTILDKILQSATDTEHVHTLMSDILSEQVYFRLNPHLSHQVSMDDTNEDHLKALEEDTVMYVRRNENLFKELGQALVTKRSILQQTCDEMKLQKNLLKFYMNQRFKVS